MRSSGFRRHRALRATTLACALALTGAACGSGSDDGRSSDGRTRITVNCMPPRSAKVDNKNFADDIAAFEKRNPGIDIVPSDAFPCQDPKTFDAKLAGGQMEDVFYVYFTDVKHVVDIHQAADITDYVKDVKGYEDVRKPLKDIFTVDGKVYGLVRTDYSLGLVYNRALFEKAGLDPDRPPASWEEVRAAAKRIGELGKGYVGYADYSASNQGGWHFTAEMYSRGGDVVSADGKKAAVDSAQGRAVLDTLHDMRWTDTSMGSKQLLIINDVQQMMGSGKLGMYLAAPDNIPIIVKQFGGSYEDLAIAPMPGGEATLLGGDGYMFNKKASPEQIRAGLKWLEFQNLTPGSGLNDWERAAELKAPVGLPQPQLWTGATAEKDDALKKRHANVPAGNYRSFADAEADLEARIEPPKAQQIYSVLDGVVSAVLTQRDADTDRLLKEASSKIDGILARS